MTTWGLGIEHEMKLKFQNKKLLGNGYINYYIDSLLIDGLNKYNKVNYYQKYHKKASKNIISDEYHKKMNIQIMLRKKAFNKENFPFEDSKLFQVTEYIFEEKKSYKIGKSTEENLHFYIENYILYHQPQLFFNLREEEQSTYVYTNIVDNLELIRSFQDKKECLYFYYDLIKNIKNEIYLQEYKKRIETKLKRNNLTFSRMGNYHTILLIKKNNRSNNNNNELNRLIKIKADKITSFMTNNFKFSENQKFIDTIFTLYNNNIPHLDYSSNDYLLEFKTIYYKNVNYEKTLDEIILYETSFMEYMTYFFEQFGYKNYGMINYDAIGTREEGIELVDIFNSHYESDNNLLQFYDYTGSYHLWVTVPYNKDLSKTKFLNVHANLANKLQLLEPLISCHFSSPSFDIKYNKDYPSKMSYRHFINKFSNYGSSDVSLINGTMYSDNINKLFFKVEKNPKVYNVDLHQKIIMNQNDTIIKNYNALSQRMGTNKIYNFITTSQSLRKNSRNVKVKSFYEIFFKSKKKAFEKALNIYKNNNNIYKVDFFGADIRTALNDRLMYPPTLIPYDKIYMPKENQFIQYHLDELGNVVSKPKYNYQSYKKILNSERIGIEFRIFDHFPTQYMNQILALLPYLVVESLNDYPIEDIHDTFISKQFWHNEMAEVILQGYKHHFSSAYINHLNKEFGLNINYVKDKINSTLLFKKLVESYEDKYKKNRKFKMLLNKLRPTKEVQYVSINELATKIILKSQ